METKFGPLTLIPGENSGRYPYCHSLYVEADLRVVIDPASDKKRLEQIKNGPGVDAVWLSHYHEDHFMYLNMFEDKKLWISKADAPPLEDLEILLDYYGMNVQKDREFWRRVLLEDFNYRPRRADRLFKGEEIIDLAGVRVEVIPTPGHTPGHCSFFFPKPGLLFLGDYDLTPFGPYYGDAHSDIDATIVSVNRLRRIPAKVWVTSHETGLFLTDPGDIWDQYLAAIDEREAKLLDLLTAPRTMAKIVEARILYRKEREPKEFFDFSERAHMSKHLERLMVQGRVVRRGETYYRV
ncbi:MAG: MBL fold metallo-hydrolase [Thermodesulfobacteriota bacterium]|nr:MBL fold metallo-hydrolase [Thermodesulfobacteriota bacterium]